MMQVACHSCGAVYEFDAATIPAEGYDAQCTGCNGVFFVKPEAPAPVAAQPAPAAEQISVACNTCGIQYQFMPADIPVEGYDAQCTQCQSIFFVSREGSPVAAAGGAAPAVTPAPSTPAVEPVALSTPAATAPVPATDLAAAGALSSPAGSADVSAAAAPDTAVPVAPDSAMPVAAEAVVPATPDAAMPVAAAPIGVPALAPEVEETASPTAALSDSAPGQATPDEAGGEIHENAAFFGQLPEQDGELLDLHADLGEPAAAPDGASMEDDFEAIMSKKRRRRKVAGASLLGSLVFMGLLFIALPGVWDVTFGPILGIKARIHPDAIPLVAEGNAKLLDDTAAGYASAKKLAEEALAIDDLYPDAIALAVLANTFRGADFQTAGRALRARGVRAIAELAALQEARGKARGKDAKARMEALRADIEDLNAKATASYQTGGDALREAEAHLRRGLRLFSGSAAVIAASGIFIANDSDALSKARRHMQVALKLHGVGADLDLANPPDMWVAFLEGVLRGASPSDKAMAPAAFAAALRLQPRLQRARSVQLPLLKEVGKSEEARIMANAIISDVPHHAKAKAFVAMLDKEAQLGAPKGLVADNARKATRSKKKKRR